MHIYIYINADNTIAATSKNQIPLASLQEGISEVRVSDDDLKAKLKDGYTIENLALREVSFVKDGLDFRLDFNEEPKLEPEVDIEDVRVEVDERIKKLFRDTREVITDLNDRTQEAFAAFDLEVARRIVDGSASDGEKELYRLEIAERGIVGETIETLAQNKLNRLNSIMEPLVKLNGIQRAVRDKFAAADTVEKIEAVWDEALAKVTAVVE